MNKFLIAKSIFNNIQNVANNKFFKFRIINIKLK